MKLIKSFSMIGRLSKSRMHKTALTVLSFIDFQPNSTPILDNATWPAKCYTGYSNLIDNYCDFLLALLNAEPLLKRGDYCYH